MGGDLTGASPRQTLNWTLQAPLLSPTPLEAVGFVCSVPQFTPNEESTGQVGGGPSLGLGLGLGLSSNWGTYPSKPLRGISPHRGRQQE